MPEVSKAQKPRLIPFSPEKPTSICIVFEVLVSSLVVPVLALLALDQLDEAVMFDTKPSPAAE